MKDTMNTVAGTNESFPISYVAHDPDHSAVGIFQRLISARRLDVEGPDLCRGSARRQTG